MHLLLENIYITQHNYISDSFHMLWLHAAAGSCMPQVHYKWLAKNQSETVRTYLMLYVAFRGGVYITHIKHKTSYIVLFDQ